VSTNEVANCVLYSIDDDEIKQGKGMLIESKRQRWKSPIPEYIIESIPSSVIQFLAIRGEKSLRAINFTISQLKMVVKRGDNHITCLSFSIIL
jgi:hypothetical protein